MTFSFPDIDARELRLEVEQTSHLFPFGQAVQSVAIASCYDQVTDSALDNYCQYVRSNFNWIVDTYRNLVDYEWCLLARSPLDHLSLVETSYTKVSYISARNLFFL